MKRYHFSGAGNDFVVFDGRGADMTDFRETSRIQALCQEFGTDGLMILTEDPDRADFRMEFYNPDGSGGMMCGNGGRCIVAFADYLGIRPAQKDFYHFIAPDGPHTAEILDRPKDGLWTVKLRMKDVEGVSPVLDGWFLDTGTRHFVRLVPDTESVCIAKEGPRYRHDPAFAPLGANVNFVERRPDGRIRVRTFEKGVEGETLACGTGITASAIAAWYAGERSALQQPVHTDVRARKDDLSVDFTPRSETSFTEVYLTGPAELLQQS